MTALLVLGLDPRFSLASNVRQTRPVSPLDSIIFPLSFASSPTVPSLALDDGHERNEANEANETNETNEAIEPNESNEPNELPRMRQRVIPLLASECLIRTVLTVS